MDVRAVRRVYSLPKYIVGPDGPEWFQWVSGSRGTQNGARWRYAAPKHPLLRLSCLEISEKINEAVLLAKIGANNDYRKREIIGVAPACIRIRARIRIRDAPWK